MSKAQESRWWRRLRALGELAGDTRQQDIAERLGVSEAAVSGWKRGTPPRAETIVVAAEAYGVDPVELFRIAFVDEEPEPDPPKARRPRTPRPKIPLEPRQDMPPY